MAGVDLSDQLLSYLLSHSKTVKWWKKLAFHLLTLTFIQAHILHNKFKKQHGQKTWKLEKFVRTLCYSLALRGNSGQLAQQVAPVPANNLDRLKGRHFLVPYDEQEGKKRGYCVVCYARLAKTGARRDELKK